MNPFIYLVDFGEVVKVGVSKYPEHRFRVLSKQFDLSVVNTFMCQTGNAYLIEGKVKSAFTHKLKPWGGVTTETFSCSMDSLKEYVLGALGSIDEPVDLLVDYVSDDYISLKRHIDDRYCGSLSEFAQHIGSTYQQVQRYIKMDCIWHDGEVWQCKTKLTNRG